MYAFLSFRFLFRKGLGSGKGLLKMLTDDVTAEEKTQTLGAVGLYYEFALRS